MTQTAKLSTNPADTPAEDVPPFSTTTLHQRVVLQQVRGNLRDAQFEMASHFYRAETVETQKVIWWLLDKGDQRILSEYNERATKQVESIAPTPIRPVMQ